MFDEGLGDLFVVRAAGEVPDTAVIGSIEYAVRYLSVPLIVVLGHEGCGAVSAAVDVVDRAAEFDGAVAALVRSIEPAVQATARTADPSTFLAACVAEQARRSAGHLLERSTIIRDKVADGTVTVTPATYQLTTGRVNRL